jgi:hypothetical protein
MENNYLASLLSELIPMGWVDLPFRQKSNGPPKKEIGDLVSAPPKTNEEI